MDKKYKEADEWMKKAADSGNEDAKIYRAALVPGFAFGMYNKVRDNREVAYKQLTIAAQDGHLNAQFHLGVMFDEDGDSLTAIEWYKKAAAAGHPAAQAVLDMTEKYE
jgi:TPR repeat protein